MNTYRKIGVIADDFTGASDAASFLAKSGARVIMCNEIPGKMTADFDALVVALKSRSAAKEEALAQSGQALQFLREQGCEQFYFKYCSTFDSTPQGNIGVVMDALMETLDVPYSLLCPSLPVNGRTVLNGILYVNGQPLSESPMKDHPLNPMWDSEIANLMRPQSHFPCEVMSREQMKTEWIEQLKQKHAKERFYLIPDYETDADGEQIASLFGDLPLLSGGSGLLEYLYRGERHAHEDAETAVHRAILLCASCSQASKNQVHAYQESGYPSVAVDAGALLDGTLDADSLFTWVKQQPMPVLIYSDAIDKDMQTLRTHSDFAACSAAMERFMAEMSRLAYAEGYERIVVAGGETSGAVIRALGFESFFIERSVDPGVPILRPLDSPNHTLILKSGNFGSRDFFKKASQ